MTGEYSLVLTKVYCSFIDILVVVNARIFACQACFLHRDYLSIYTREMSRTMLDYIDQHRNCEDLAMSVKCTSIFISPPFVS